jgi:hypothetical protein
MQKLSGTSSGKNNKSCKIFHNESKKISYAIFWTFYEFLHILQAPAKGVYHWKGALGADLDRSWGRRGARRRGSAVPPRAGRGSDCSGEVGGALATGGSRWATVGAKGGGGSLGWGCSRSEPEACRGCLHWRRRRAVGLRTSLRRPL